MTELILLGAVLANDLSRLAELPDISKNPHRDLALWHAVKNNFLEIGNVLIAVGADCDYEPNRCFDKKCFDKDSNCRNYHHLSPRMLFLQKYLKLSPFWVKTFPQPSIELCENLSFRYLRIMVVTLMLTSNEAWNILRKKMSNPFQSGRIASIQQLRLLFEEFPLSGVALEEFEDFFGPIVSNDNRLPTSLQKLVMSDDGDVSSSENLDQMLADALFHPEILKWLFEHGGSVTPQLVLEAVEKGHPEIFPLLIEYCQVERKDEILSQLRKASNLSMAGTFAYLLV